MLTDRCSNNLNNDINNRMKDLKDSPSGRPAFFIYLLLILISTYGFSNSIPWSSEAETVLYYNAPSSWVLGFENIKGLYKAVKELKVETQKRLLIKDTSEKYNLDASVLENFFQSRLIIISDEQITFNFQDFFNNIFNTKEFLSNFYTLHEKNIICVEHFEGVETLINLFSDFSVKTKVFGDFVAFSSNEDYLEEQFPNMLSRNEFSKDVIFYSESRTENIEITNAYSFLNFEKKELIEERADLLDIERNSQFLLDNISIPFVFDDPTYFEINSSSNLKEYFYDNFEVFSSIGEWLSVFELLERGTLYTFFFENDFNWMLGFRCSDEMLSDKQWLRYITSWGLDSKETIKPFADEYYLSLWQNYFVISNFEIEQLDENNQIIADIMTKFERNMLLKAEIIDQDYNPDISKLKVYHFSYIDDKIIKDLFRIF